MAHYRYFIVGGGMAAAAAIKGIRKADAEGSIGLIGKEEERPYNRPPLSKGLWKGKPIEKIWRKVDDEGVDFHLGRAAVVLDPQQKLVTDDRGDNYTYERLMLATGGSPRRLPFGGEEVLYFRTLDDYRYLRSKAEGKRRFAVIGGGFIGSEIAAALMLAGQAVVMLFPEAGIGGLAFPADLSRFLNGYYRERGVEVMAGEMVSGIQRNGGSVTILTESGKSVSADEVVAGIGIRPNTELAEAAGLAVENGILVDEYLHASQPDIFAAGDVANFYNPALQERLRVEHEDNANSMGALAGQNMASDNPAPYHHLPYFYSDLFDVGYEAVGELSHKLETFADWQEPYQKGVVYFLDTGRVRGVLLWNVWDQIDAARSLIAAPGPFTRRDLEGKIK